MEMDCLSSLVSGGSKPRFNMIQKNNGMWDVDHKAWLGVEDACGGLQHRAQHSATAQRVFTDPSVSTSCRVFLSLSA